LTSFEKKKEKKMWDGSTQKAKKEGRELSITD
jgi:hypothetical protein